jgi:exosortase
MEANKEERASLPFRPVYGRLRAVLLTMGNRTGDPIMIAILVLSLLVFRTPITAGARLSLQDDRYFQIVLAPVLCLFMLYRERVSIFSNARFSPRLGTPLLSLALILCLAAEFGPASGDAYISRFPTMFGVVLVWMAAFILCYGLRSFKAALFPLCFLLLTIPIPPAIMDKVEFGLQRGSADVGYALFRLAGIPVFRQGMTFSLPGLDIEVAPQCSGIRACLVFMIVGIMVSRILLRSAWRKCVLIIAIVPITIVKNATRIVVISALSAYVDRGFLFGRLHHYGGMVFIFIAVALFLPLLSVLRKSEIRSLPSVPILD